MRGAGLDIASVSEVVTTDTAMQKILDQIESRKSQIKTLKAKK